MVIYSNTFLSDSQRVFYQLLKTQFDKNDYPWNVWSITQGFPKEELFVDSGRIMAVNNAIMLGDVDGGLLSNPVRALQIDLSFFDNWENGTQEIDNAIASVINFFKSNSLYQTEFTISTRDGAKTENLSEQNLTVNRINGPTSLDTVGETFTFYHRVLTIKFTLYSTKEA